MINKAIARASIFKEMFSAMVDILPNLSNSKVGIPIITVPVKRDYSHLTDGLDEIEAVTRQMGKWYEDMREFKDMAVFMLDNLPMLVSYVDDEYIYRFNNMAYRDWFKKKKGEVTGHHIKDVLGQEAFEYIKPFMDQALSGKKVSFEREVPYNGGNKTKKVYAVYYPHIVDGKTIGFFSTVEEVK